jgi:hypothetical protein
VRPYYFLFRLYCENRARQRRKISKLLADWEVLQHDANGMDSRYLYSMREAGVDLMSPTGPCKHPFFSFTFDLSTTLLAHYVQLGLETVTDLVFSFPPHHEL